MSALDGVALKYTRAQEHLKAIQDSIKEFAKSDPYSVATEFDPDTGDKIWRVVGEPKIPPRRISVVIGDCLTNFRASLDYLAWQLVLTDLAPKLPSLISRVCSVPAPSWGGLQTRWV